MRSTIVLALLVGAIAGSASAKLPPPSDDAKAMAAEAAAKAAWSGQVGAYQLCQAMDRVAAKFGHNPTSAGTQPADFAPCVDPGPYVAARADQKPLEAAGAHSPAASNETPDKKPDKTLENAEAHSAPGTATTPPVMRGTPADAGASAAK